jgi:hypothetical protein
MRAGIVVRFGLKAGRVVEFRKRADLASIALFIGYGSVIGAPHSVLHRVQMTTSL